MADTLDPNAGSDVINEILISEKEAEGILDVINATLAPGNLTGKPVSTPEGMAVAYGSLVLMALIPIFLGSFRSVKQDAEDSTSEGGEGSSDGIISGLFVGSRTPGEPVESMSSKDAAMFPIIASVTLFGLYIFFKVFSKEHINLLLTVYFFVLGVFALAHILSPIINKLLPVTFPNANYQLLFFKKEGCSNSAQSQGSTNAAGAAIGDTVSDANDAPVNSVTVAAESQVAEGASTAVASEPKSFSLPEEILNYEFDRKDLVSLLVCVGVGCWYFLKKHWIANNLFGLAFAVNGVELLQLPRVSTGCILLGGLFFYDIFWVFGTDVMVTVAKSFEAPIKLVFPQDILENGPLMANNFAMLGLGDIVIPGIFIALLLRFDLSQKKDGPKVYFYTGFLAYFLGLLLTIFVMHVYKHAQPALLYLVPACLGAPLLVALLKGEVMLLFNYEDQPEEPELTEDKKEQ